MTETPSRQTMHSCGHCQSTTHRRHDCNRAKNLAFQIDQAITNWEISHHGQFIFGEHWRKKLQQIILGERS